MKRLLAIAAILAASTCVCAQVVDTTVCNVLKDPASFNGKIVRIKGAVLADFDQFAIQDTTCSHNINSIWLSYPEGTKAKSGPAAILELQAAHNFAGTFQPVTRTPVQLDKNKDFKQFDSLLSAPHKASGMCLGCTRNIVSATFVGRLDGVSEAGVRRNTSGKIIGIAGFGNLNEYKARLVLQSVSDVTAKEIDFSKTDSVAKTDTPTASAGSDPVAAAHKAATAFGTGNAAGERVEKAAAAFGKPGEQNGVIVGFGPTNEVSAKEGTQSTQDAPNGVLLNCTFNKSRLEGDALSRAIVHVGQHVVDLETPTDGSGPYELEYQAWGTTVISGIGFGQKSLTLPGGFLAWNAAWAPADRDNLLDDAVRNFLITHELFSR